MQVSFEDMTSMKILYGSVTGKSKYFASEFLKKCLQKGYLSSSLVDLKDYDPEDGLANDVI